MNKRRYLLLLILTAGFLLRFWFLLDFMNLPVMDHVCGPDVSEYYTAARHIQGGAWLNNHPGIHAPLYPYVLALFLTLCRNDLLWTRLLQSFIFMSMLLIPVYLMLHRRTAGLSGSIRFLPEWSILILALYPPLAVMQCDLFSENLMLPLLLWSLWSMTCSKNFFLSGLSAGASMLAHPGCIFFLPFSLIYMIMTPAGTVKKRLLRTGVFILGAVLLIAPYSIYNSIRAKRLVMIQDNSMFNAWLGNHAGATGTCAIPPGNRWDAEFDRADKAAAKQGCSRETYYRNEILRYLWNEPGQFAAGLIRKAGMAVCADELTTWSDVSALKLIFWHRYMVHGWFLLLLMAGGPVLIICSEKRHFRRFMAPEILLTVSILAGQILLVTAGRYRMPLIVPLAIGSAFFICAWRNILYDTRRILLITGTMMLLFCIAVKEYGIPVQPERDYARSLLGEAYLKAKLPRQLIVLYETPAAGASFPDRRLNLLGHAWYDLKDLKQAEKYYREAVQQFPLQAENWMNYAIVLSDTGSYRAAAAYLAEAEKRACNPAVSADIAFNYGEVFRRMRQFDPAEKQYLKALQAEPLHRKSLNNLGIVYLTKPEPEPEKAIPLFARAAKLEPENPNLKVNLAMALTMSGQKNEAEHLLHQILQTNPDCIPAKRLLNSLKR